MSAAPFVGASLTTVPYAVHIATHLKPYSELHFTSTTLFHSLPEAFRTRIILHLPMAFATITSTQEPPRLTRYQAE